MKKIICQYYFEVNSYTVVAVGGGYIDPFSLDNVENFNLLRNDVLVLEDCVGYFESKSVPTYDQVARFERNEGQFHKRGDPT